MAARLPAAAAWSVPLEVWRVLGHAAWEPMVCRLTAGVDPERPSHRDLWPFDQLYDVPFPRGLDAIPTLGRVQTVFGFRC